MTTKLREFPKLSPAAFQHPLDVQATYNLRRVPFLALALKAISSSVFERQMRLLNISSAVRLGPNQGRSIYEKFVQAGQILDLPDLPEVYVSNQYTINAVAFGIEKYQIILYSGLIDALEEEELMAVIGHELGHVKCEHMLYKTMAYILRYLGVEVLYNLLPAGTGALASLPLLLGILHWERMAEFSCDRAALLVTQKPDAVASALAKLAGGSKKILPEINMEGILAQAEEYEEADEQVIEKLFKVNMLLLQTHPFPIVRAREILDWGQSETYRQIMAGEYLRSDGSGSAAAAATASADILDPVSRKCPDCGQLNSLAANSCLACGSSLKGASRVCSNCGIRVFSGWTTCARCGNDLMAA